MLRPHWAGATLLAPRYEAQPARTWLRGVVAEATLVEPPVPAAVSAGRDGRHTEALGYLLAEMQHLARSHPGATW